MPSGTVTFLFSDVEGSTRLLEEHGDAYAAVLAEYRRLLRRAVSSHGGVEVDTQGDAFFVAFGRASDAVAAAREAQQALEATPVRARIGIHTGEAAVTAEGYVGIDVVRGARIAAAGHGGQVLLSKSTRELLDGEVEVRDLGEYRLKDLSAPQRLFQLGDGCFPPLKSLGHTNLPVQSTPLVGRQRELAEVAALLRRYRLVTLVGPGGSGKTRLALHAAAEAVDEFDDGVWWVSMAALADADLVEPAIAQVAGAKHGLEDHLRSQRALLLLDNFEHVRQAAPRVAELLREAPQIVVLATSRAPLHIGGEHEYPVPPMVEEEAVALFSERAQAVRWDFEADEHVRAICRRLDGLPLALELAAARVRVLPPAKLAARLERALPLLTAGSRDAPRRQRTLRATLEWSYDLLDEAEKQLFARLAVFAGSFSLEAAEQICGANLDLVQSLVENNLLRATDGRFSFLETVREFARERLDERGEVEGAARQHGHFYLGVAEEAKPRLGQADVLAALVDDEPNLRAALAYGRERDPSLMLRLVGSLAFFWFARGQFAEARDWLERALELDAGGRSLARADALRGLSGVLGLLYAEDPTRRRDLLEEAIRLYREHGDEAGLARSLNALGVVFVNEADAGRGDAERALDRAAQLFEESVSIWRRPGERVDSAACAAPIGNLAEVAFRRGDLTAAKRLTSEALALARAEADDVYIASANQRLAWIAFLEGRNEDAARLLRERLRFSLAIRSGWPGTGLALAALIAARRGKQVEAARLLGALNVQRTRLGIRDWGVRGKRIAQAIQATEQELVESGYALVHADAPELSLDEMHELALRLLE